MVASPRSSSAYGDVSAVLVSLGAVVWLALRELGGLGQKPGVLPQARTERFAGASIWLFVETNATAPMAMRSAMTAIIMRRFNDWTRAFCGVSPASGASKAIIMASIFSGTACRSFPINSS